MQRAGIDSWIWVIIFVVVAASKLWSQFQQKTEGGDQASEPMASKPPPILPVGRQELPSAHPIPRGPTAAPSSSSIEEKWGEAPKSLRDFMEQMRRQMQPPVARPAPPSVATAPLPVAEPVAPAEPVPAPEPEPVPAPTVVSEPSRASRWSAAMRDKQNVRNIIIGAEVLGPPKGSR